MAADFNFPDVLKFFLDKGANVEVKSGWGDTPLHKAAEQDNVECVQLLLSSGANPNSKNLKNETPLEITKNAQIQRLLLQFGAKK
ncbi:Ankyrin repeat family [Trichomonas vaginalis G3]|uniref:Ankyrin repeat family n=1 Tax=Trichomonas vaginalis (strain ATCC PRA-98 / G3) TaxID=412133 RepID=UPI0021E5A96C|nr:Ankyrin repeat family [Trichomonas vaginalis G3]KAI5519026.1 Ankyrin repeat family [Trichomonas vaginalis G3]